MRFKIFKTGTHKDSAGNERAYTPEDLDQIVGKFEEAKEEKPIVVGHPATDSPAWGWISKLERIGEDLFAETSKVVAEFEEAVKQGLYKNRSIALTPDLELRHVGFLGGAAPAVKGLGDIQFAEGSDVIEFEEEAVKQDPPADPPVEDPLADPPVEDEKDKEIAQLKRDKAELQQKLNQQKADEKKTEFEAFVTGLEKEHKLLPAQHEKVMATYQTIISVGAGEFSEETEKHISTFKDFLSTLPVAVEKGKLRGEDESVQKAPLGTTEGFKEAQTK